MLTFLFNVNCMSRLPSHRIISRGDTNLRLESTPRIVERSMRLNDRAFKSVDGEKEGKVIFVIAALLFIRSLFIPVDIKTATVCPSGLNAERTLEKFQKYDPDYHCLPGNELAKSFLTSRWVFPGDPDFDTNWLKVELRGVRKAGTEPILNK